MVLLVAVVVGAVADENVCGVHPRKLKRHFCYQAAFDPIRRTDQTNRPRQTDIFFSDFNRLCKTPLDPGISESSSTATSP